MNVVVLSPVRDFIESLDPHLRTRVHRLIKSLEQYGSDLGMPIAKPIGSGLWELRSKAQPAIRILYGFCDCDAVLVLALKKQQPALSPRDVDLARKRFAAYCE